MIGIYRSCGHACDPGCLERPGAPHLKCPGCGEGVACFYGGSLCKDESVLPADEQDDGCLLRFGDSVGRDGPTRACRYPDEVCVSHRKRVPNTAPNEDRYAGSCLNPSYCEPATEFYPNSTCFYADLSPVDDGASQRGVSGTRFGDVPFCGLECPRCPIQRPDGEPFASSCVGLNEERGVGLCTAPLRCHEGSQFTDPSREWDERFGESLACLVVRDPVTEELWDWGWVTGVEPCKQYRALYPDRFDCRNSDWDPLLN